MGSFLVGFFQLLFKPSLVVVFVMHRLWFTVLLVENRAKPVRRFFVVLARFYNFQKNHFVVFYLVCVCLFTNGMHIFRSFYLYKSFLFNSSFNCIRTIQTCVIRISNIIFRKFKLENYFAILRSVIYRNVKISTFQNNNDFSNAINIVTVDLDSRIIVKCIQIIVIFSVIQNVNPPPVGFGISRDDCTYLPSTTYSRKLNVYCMGRSISVALRGESID